MELYERILSKPEINSRIVQALLAIVSNGLVASKSDLAECLGAKPSKFSEILNYRMSAGVDMIAKICDLYDVDPYWALMGRGNKIFRDTSKKLPPYFIESDNDLDRKYHLTQKESSTESEIIKTNEHTAMADMFYQKTLEQAEIIGQLKARIEQLEREKGKDVSDVRTSGVANAG